MSIGVYIKGMEMPECCEDCKLFNLDYDSCNYNNCFVGYEYSNKRMEDCPLVAVPDHGDLVDRDETIREICRYTFPNFSLAVQRIKSVPAIVPAEKAQNNLEVMEI